MLSIIVPVLNEAELITPFLQSLKSIRDNGHEIIVVDGGSTDTTFVQAEPFVDRVISSGKGRAIQMNAGAMAATGDVFVFIHVDTFVSEESWFQQLISMSDESKWGFCKIALNGKQPFFRMIEFFMNVRSRTTHIATGDQCLFIGRELFEAVKGFPSIALMEDIAVCKLLRKKSQPVVLNTTVTTSSRRWEEQGIVKTVLLMWRLRLLFFFGVSPARLARSYYDSAA